MFRNSSVLLIAALCLLAAAPAAFAPAAFAHDSWIARGGYRGPINNEWCCGHDDCVVIPPASVKINGAGYELTAPAETVPYKETLTSIDGQFWRCHRPDGSRRCFFAPALGH